MLEGEVFRVTDPELPHHSVSKLLAESEHRKDSIGSSI
jgi:hypothetical protein